MANTMVSLTKALTDILEKQQNYDVTFLVEGEDIHALKFFLSLRSPAFKTMIEQPLSYVDGKIIITDPKVTSSDFKDFLKFLYTDECEITRKNLEVMLHLGHMYLVPLLVEKCIEFVENNINASNFLEFSELGMLYNDQCSLLTKCLENFQVKCFRKKEDTKIGYYSSSAFSLCETSPELVLKIAQDCKRIGELTEEKFFKLVYEWAERKCLKNVTLKKKEVLKDILPFIKFENLKPLTLATIVSTNDLLSKDELLDSLLQSTINESNKPFVDKSEEKNNERANTRKSPWQGHHRNKLCQSMEDNVPHNNIWGELDHPPYNWHYNPDDWP